MKPPVDAGGADPDEPRDGADAPRDQAPSEEQINGEPTAEGPTPRQSDDRPVQLPLPGMGEPTDDSWTPFEFAAAIEQCARQGTPFTSADVRKLVPGEPNNPNLIGLEFARSARAGVIVPLAAVQSTVPSRRRGLCRIWQGAA